MARLPSKLPDAGTLGELPSARTGRHIAKLDIDAYGAQGRGLASIGQAIAGIGGSISEADDRNEALDVQQRLLELEQQTHRGLDESRRTLSGDPTGFADRTRESFTETGRETFARARESGLSQRGLERLARGMAGIREQLHSRAFGHELNQRGHFGEDWATNQLNQLRNDYLTAPDDDTRERIYRNAEETIQLGRQRYGFGHESERRLRTGVDKMLEDDALARPDSYAALLELRHGDQRIQQPSTGEISEFGLSRLESTVRQQGMSPAQIREAETRLRTDTGALSKFVRDNLAEGVNLTQAQHDALVGYGVVRGRDALQELLPLVNSEGPGREKALSQAMRAGGGLTAQEQPSLGDVARESPSGPAGPIEIRPVPGDRRPMGAAPRQGSIEGIVLHHTSGTTLNSALSQNQIARTGYNYYIDRDGTPYQFAPDEQRMNHIMPPGSNARIAGAWPQLSSDNTIAISVVAQNDGDITDAQRNTLRNLTTQLADRHGIDRNNIIGHGDIQHTRERTEGSTSREFREGRTRVAQRSGTMTDASPPSSTRAQLPGQKQVDEYADLIEGRAPASRYARMPADRRRVLEGKIEQALRPALMADMDDDLEQIRQTGQDRRLPDGTTSFTRAARVLTPNQFSRYQIRREEAMAQYRALNGLQDMTPDEIAQRREQINPARAPQTGERFGLMNRTRSMFDTAVQRMEEAADKDPAASVEGGLSLPRVGTRRRETIGPDGQPILSSETDIDHRLAPAREVAEAHALVRRRLGGHVTIGTGENGALVISHQGQPDAAREAWKIIMDARMDAQARRGIPERSRSPITRSEADELLNMPRRVSDAGEFENLIKAAADRAYERYGPYARQALDAAIRFRANLSNEQSQIASGFLQRMVDGSGYSRDDIARLGRVLELSREQEAWMGRPSYVERDGQVAPWPPAAFVPRPQAAPQPNVIQRMFGGGSRPSQGMMGAPISGGQQQNAMPGVTVQWPKPTPQDITDLQKFPDLQSAFDSRFGPGSAAAYLQGQAPTRR